MKIVIEIDDNLYTRLLDNGVEYASDMRRACVLIIDCFAGGGGASVGIEEKV